MKSHFTNKFFAGNRARLREVCDSDLIVLTANGLLQRGTDSAYRFTQDANFWYLTGIDEPEVVLVMDGSDEYLIMPQLSDYQKAFDGEMMPKLLRQRSGVKTVYSQEEGWQRLATRLKKLKRVATVAAPPNYVETYGIYTNPAKSSLVKKLKSCQTALKMEHIEPRLARQRMIKQPEEIAAIQTAIDITMASLKDVFKKKYEYEYELEAAITAGFRHRGASGHAFEPIVAAGQRACVLHNVGNDSKIGRGDLVVVDVGAEIEHYAADITRTINFGQPTSRQQAVCDAVLEAQKFALSLLKPGATFKAYRQQTDRFIGQKLRELGLIKTVSQENIRRYYPHSVSHFLGLNVHDAGDYSQPLQAGMVLTVEPGIYIPEEGIGVRIEDDVLVTETGIKILSSDLPRRLG